MIITNVKQAIDNQSHLERFDFDFTLEIKDNSCTPEEIDQILVVTDVALNQIIIECATLTHLPDLFARFEDLDYLTVNTNQTLNIDFLANATSLSTLTIEAEDIFWQNTHISFPKLKTLVVNVKKLTDVPAFLLGENIRKLHVFSEKLTKLELKNPKLLENLETLHIKTSENLDLSILEFTNKLTNLFIESEDIFFSKSLQFFPNATNIELAIRKLSVIPEYLLSDKIKMLTINSSELEEIPSNTFKLLKSLTVLSIVAPIVTSELSTQQSLDISPLVNIEVLDVFGNTVPIHFVGIEHCRNLNAIVLEHCNCLPQGLEKCMNLKDLRIYNGTFTELPEWIVHSKKLRRLTIIDSKLEHVPKDWSNATQLYNLCFLNCQIEDFSFIYTIPSRVQVQLAGNPVRDKLFILDGTKNIYFRECAEWFTFGAIGNKLELFVFLFAIARSGLTRADKEWFFDVFKDQKNLSIPKDWNLARLTQGLNIPYKKLTRNIQKYLQELPLNKTAAESLKSGSVCFFDGKMLEKKAVLKEKLSLLNIKISDTLNDSVTLIILGSKPTASIAFFQQKEIPFLLESQLYERIKRVGEEEKYFIVEETVGETTMFENLKQLLSSSDAASVKIGFSMLKSGGVPNDIIEDLVILCKTAKDESVRTEARKILRLQAPALWLPIINDRTSFVGFKNKDERALRWKFYKMAKSADKKSVLAFALLFYKKFNSGLSFVHAEADLGSPERIKADSYLVKENQIDI